MVEKTKDAKSGSSPGRWRPVVWFFIPLTQPLGLPDGWTSAFGYAPDMPEVLQWGDSAGLSAILRVWRRAASGEPVLADQRVLLDVAHRVLTNQVANPPEKLRTAQARQPDTGGEAAPLSQNTVVQALIPIENDAGSREELEWALDTAIASIRQLQECYALVKQHAIRKVSLQSLPLQIPYAVGRAPVTPGLPILDTMGLFVVNAPTVEVLLPAGNLEASDLERLADALDQASRGSAFAAYADLRNETWVQRLLDGNYRMAAITAGMAGEVLLDVLLLHLMWESGTSPPEAASVFDRIHKTRVLTEYHARIGGSWVDSGKGPVALYLRDVVGLRNRVVHAGYEPNIAETDIALEVLESLERFIGDRLVENRNRRRYPRTAIAWIRVEGIKRRGRWTNSLEKLVSDASEPDWTSTFSHFQSHVERVRSNLERRAGQDPTALALYLELRSGGQERWILHCTATGSAAVIDEPLFLSASQRITIPAIRAHFSETETPVRSKLEMDFSRVTLPAPIAWLPDYELAEDLSIALPHHK